MLVSLFERFFRLSATLFILILYIGKQVRVGAGGRCSIVFGGRLLSPQRSQERVVMNALRTIIIMY